MVNIKVCLVFSFLFFSGVCWCNNNVFIKDDILYVNNNISNSKLDISKSSDDDVINLNLNNSDDRIDIYSSSASNSSYYVFSVKYDHNKEIFFQNRFEYVIPCSYCTDLKTEYCSNTQSKAISYVDFSQWDENNAICYSSYEGEIKGVEFSDLDALLKAFDSSRQYMKSFSCSDIKSIVDRFPRKNNYNNYQKIISLLKLENEYSLVSCLNNYLENSISSKSGVIKHKVYLYKTPSSKDKTGLYLIKGDIISILNEKNTNGEIWFFVNYKGKKEINMWIKADSVDLN